MPFISNTSEDRAEMLKEIGVSSFEELIQSIPEEVRLKGLLNLPEAMSEYDVVKELTNYAKKNKSADTYTCFLGGGVYDHFIPSIVGSVLEKPEFKTAYTPYQAEVSQGTLQAMYEYQSMICQLSGMDVSNASMYDGASSLAEACLLANAQNRRTEFIFAGSINPNYLNVIETVCQGKDFTFKSFVAEDGTCDLAGLSAAVTETTSAVIVQQPNVYGNLEDVYEIEKIAHSKKALFDVAAAPISLGILEAHGNYNADILVAVGLSIGLNMNYGGPYLGVFAIKNDLVRKMPGRVAGVTQDLDGKRGFVLTLQTREQQIKREKATSNICSNQGLMMLASAVYMTAMGKQGIKEVAERCFEAAHYLADQIKKIKGFSLLNDKPFFMEFLVKTPVPAAKIIEEAEKEGILAGIDTSRFAECKEVLLIAVTEKRTKEEIDKLIDVLKTFAS